MSLRFPQAEHNTMMAQSADMIFMMID
jgi:hypothetical protein